MKKRCSPIGMANAIGIPVLFAIVLVPAGGIALSEIIKNKPHIGEGLIVCIAMLVLFALLLAGAVWAYAVRLRRAFGVVEISENGVEEHFRSKTEFMSWEEIGWIFVLPELSQHIRTGAMLEQRICFAKEKRELTLAERLNILTAEDIISFPYLLDAEKYIRRFTDTAFDFSYTEEGRSVADIARDERAAKNIKAENSK